MAAAKYLTLCGMRFAMLQHEDLRHKFKVHIAPCTTLGCQSYDFAKYAEKTEYRLYEEWARALLIKPQARAAILHGGVIWRIALELMRLDAPLLALQKNVMSTGTSSWPPAGRIRSATANSRWTSCLSSVECTVFQTMRKSNF